MQFKLLQPTAVKVGPRQRIDIGDLSDLSSISDPKIGQIYPILIDSNDNLIDGFRRLTYCTHNNLTVKCLVRGDEDDAFTTQLLELYADIGRKERTWQERCLAATKLYEMEPGKSVRQWAEIIGTAKSNVAELITLGRMLRNQNDKELWEASGTANGMKVLLQRNIKRLEDEMNRRKALGAQAPALVKSELVEPNAPDSIDVDVNIPFLSGLSKATDTFDTLTNPVPVLVPDRPPVIISIHGYPEEPFFCNFSILYSLFPPEPTGVAFVIFNRFIDFVTAQQKYTNPLSTFVATPIVWDLISGKTIERFPFIINCKPIAFVCGKDFIPPSDRVISSVIVEPVDDNNPGALPDGLVQTLLDAVCREGDKVRCEWRDAIAVARSGRVPVWATSDKEELQSQKLLLMEHYKQVLGNVEFV